MSYANIRADLEGALSTFKADNSIDVVWNNVNTSSTKSKFIRPTIAFAPSATGVGFGGQYRIDGTVIVQIFTEVGKGVAEAYRIADLLSAVLSDRKFANQTTTLYGVLREVGTDDEARGLYQSNFIVPFRTYTS